MQNDPLVSILIPTFQRPKELRRALESVVAQTYSNLEILISNNDCANDETTTLCQELAAKDNRVSYHVQPANIGASENLYFLILLAKGEYILSMNDDDWISDNFIELTLRSLQSDPKCAIAQGRYILYDEEDQPYLTFVMDDDVQDSSVERMLSALFANIRHIIGPYHGLCRTSHFKEAQALDDKPRYGEDWMVLSKIAFFGNRHNISEVTYHKSLPSSKRTASYYANIFNTPNINENNHFEYLFLGILDSIAYDSFYDDKLDRLERLRIAVYLTKELEPKLMPQPIKPFEHIKGLKSCLRYLWRQPFALFKKKATIMLEVKKNPEQGNAPAS